ncbi:PP2C family protein-serine/threonine phosphatase [Ruicaihuangia caeni]|uniref:PP2C family protein-serine/threonine phosphatase n=1 Tax=Ruicaihuangia caeni TaxID=3042517 RepID=UPI00339030C7
MSQQSSVALPHGRVDVVASARTDVGQVRRVNEDGFLSQLPVFLVADGMGGHARGDLASRTVCEVFADRIEAGRPTTPEQVLDAIETANASVRRVDPSAMSGTTLSGIALVGTRDGAQHYWMVFNIGDSRVYGWNGSELAQLSVDHSLVQELLDAGRIGETEALTHPQRNVITRAIGAAEQVDSDVWLIPAKGRQTFLVCSDGLTKELADTDIAEVLAGAAASSENVDRRPQTPIAELLVQRAVAAGGRDNVTALVVDAIVHGRSGDGDGDCDDETTIDRSGVARELEDTLPRRPRP